MILDPSSIPPLVRGFAEAVRCNPNDQAWLRLRSHRWIDSLLKRDEGSAAMAQEILRLLRENLLGVSRVNQVDVGSRSSAEGDRSHHIER